MISKDSKDMLTKLFICNDPISYTFCNTSGSPRCLSPRKLYRLNDFPLKKATSCCWSAFGRNVSDPFHNQLTDICWMGFVACLPSWFHWRGDNGGVWTKKKRKRIWLT